MTVTCKNKTYSIGKQDHLDQYDEGNLNEDHRNNGTPPLPSQDNNPGYNLGIRQHDNKGYLCKWNIK